MGVVSEEAWEWGGLQGGGVVSGKGCGLQAWCTCVEIGVVFSVADSADRQSLVWCCRYCSVCKEHREATKQISIWKLPPVLILHLKRFSYSGHAHKYKLKEMVDFPLR